MRHQHAASPRVLGTASTGARLILPRVEVRREGRVEPLVQAAPVVSSAGVRWSGVALEAYSAAACIIPRHEHVENFINVVVQGRGSYEAITRGKSLRFDAGPSTTFVLPQGTVDELRWHGSVRRISMAIHPSLLVEVLQDGPHSSNIELIENWNLIDRHVMAIALAMSLDLEDGCPAGRLYGESLANALGVYLLRRYGARPCVPPTCRGGLSGFRLKTVLEHIEENLAEDISLSGLAAVAGMSTHHFAEMFRQSTGRPPHRYVLSRRIERAKECLRDPRRSVVEAGVDCGFINPSHFARVFRRFVGTSPSTFKAEMKMH
jgi:AraC family transcriptional regulator